MWDLGCIIAVVGLLVCVWSCLFIWVLIVFLVWLCLRGFSVCGGFAVLFVAVCCFGFSLW